MYDPYPLLSERYQPESVRPSADTSADWSSIHGIKLTPCRVKYDTSVSAPCTAVQT